MRLNPQHFIMNTLPLAAELLIFAALSLFSVGVYANPVNPVTCTPPPFPGGIPAITVVGKTYVNVYTCQNNSNLLIPLTANLSGPNEVNLNGSSCFSPLPPYGSCKFNLNLIPTAAYLGFHEFTLTVHVGSRYHLPPFPIGTTTVLH